MELHPHFEGLRHGFQSYFNSQFMSDLTLEGDLDKYYLHKIVLSAQSRYFTKILGEQFQEGQTNAIKLQGDDPIILRAMLRYMYGLDYSGDIELKPLILHAKVYALADKYEVLALKDLALRNYETAAARDWNVPDFPESIQIAYTTTPESDRGIRDIVTKTATAHTHELLRSNTAFSAVLGSNAPFGKDYAIALDGLLSNAQLCSYKCPGCTAVWTTKKEFITGTRAFYCVLCGHANRNWPQYLVK